MSRRIPAAQPRCIDSMATGVRPFNSSGNMCSHPNRVCNGAASNNATRSRCGTQLVHAGILSPAGRPLKGDWSCSIGLAVPRSHLTSNSAAPFSVTEHASVDRQCLHVVDRFVEVLHRLDPSLVWYELRPLLAVRQSLFLLELGFQRLQGPGDILRSLGVVSLPTICVSGSPRCL